MASPEILGRYSQAGFYHAPVTKCLVSSLGASHIALQIPLFSWIQKYLLCQIPHSLRKGEFWRLLTSKLAFIDTKDAVITLILLYYFRVFERRYGSRKFASVLGAHLLLSAALEVVFSYGAMTYFGGGGGAEGFSGLLSVGPLSLVMPMFVSFFHEIPKAGGSSLGGFAVSPKILPYFAGVHLMAASNANLVAGMAGIVAGLLVRQNFLWVNKWMVVPSGIAAQVYRLFGQLVESGPPEGGLMGATLEIQRTQQMEALEQQIIRQQNRYAGRRRGGGGGAFGFGMGGPIPRGPGRAPAAAPPAPVAPSEDNIRLLMDMGFSRERVEEALRRSQNDVQLATTLLLQPNEG